MISNFIKPISCKYSVRSTRLKHTCLICTLKSTSGPETIPKTAVFGHSLSLKILLRFAYFLTKNLTITQFPIRYILEIPYCSLTQILNLWYFIIASVLAQFSIWKKSLLNVYQSDEIVNLKCNQNRMSYKTSDLHLI